MTLSKTSEEVEFHAHELDGETILGHGIADVPIEAFDAVENTVADLEAYSHGDHVATVEIDTTTDEVTNVTLPGTDDAR